MATKYITLISILFLFASCDLFEARGFLLSYNSANDRFAQSKEWNDGSTPQIIISEDEEYTILVMADSHVGGTENITTFLTDAENLDVDGTAMLGDLTTGHADDFQAFANVVDMHTDVPNFVVAGNHDLYFDGWKEYYRLLGSSTYYFTVVTPTAEDLFICVETGGGLLGSDQLEWLLNLLENERPNYRNCTIMTHVNLFRVKHSPSTSPLVEELHVLLDAFVENDVTMVITGHDHRAAEIKIGNTTHLTLDALLDINKNAGYLKLDVKDGQASYEFLKLE